MPINPKYKVIPIWRKDMLKLIKQGHNVKAVCHQLHVGYDRLLSERRKDSEFDADMTAAEAEGREKGMKRFRVI